jgi:hypothetical protein
MLTNYNLQLLTCVCTSHLFLIAAVCIKVKGKWILLLNTKPVRGIEGIEEKPHSGGELSGQLGKVRLLAKSEFE